MLDLRKIKYTILIILLSFSISCFSQKKYQSINNMTVSCIVVKKDFIKKNGKPGNYGELYLRCSVQDYFIKFCESKISQKDLKKYIDKSITVKIEIRDGNWDICQGANKNSQSRIGNYAVIKKINTSSHQQTH